MFASSLLAHLLILLMSPTIYILQALQEQQYADGFDKLGMRLLIATLPKLFDSLQTAYEGW